MFSKELNFDEEPYNPTREYKHDMRAVVDWFILNSVIMSSLMLNYFYRVGISSIFEKIAHWIIFISDSLGIEIHFIRFLYWTLLDPNQGENEYVKFETVKTDLMLLCLLTLLYIMAFHFLLSPIDNFYNGNV